MDKKTTIWLSAGILAAGFFIFRYVDLLYSKSKIELQLVQAKRQIGFLEGELKDQKDALVRLAEEKSQLAGELKEANIQVTQLKAEKTEAEGHILSLIGEIQGLEKNNAEILEEKDLLVENLKDLEKKNSQMDAKLHSIPELKKVIRNLKRLRLTPALKPKVELRALLEGENRHLNFEAKEGNVGFVIKDGEPTYRRRVKIDVRPDL